MVDNTNTTKEAQAKERACLDLSTAALSFAMANGPAKEESYNAWMTLWCLIEKNFNLLEYDLSEMDSYKPNPDPKPEVIERAIDRYKALTGPGTKWDEQYLLFDLIWLAKF